MRVTQHRAQEQKAVLSLQTHFEWQTEITLEQRTGSKKRVADKVTGTAAEREEEGARLVQRVERCS
jgi:hypothetical protein